MGRDRSNVNLLPVPPLRRNELKMISGIWYKIHDQVDLDDCPLGTMIALPVNYRYISKPLELLYEV